MALNQGFRGSMLAGVAFLAFTANSAAFAQAAQVDTATPTVDTDGDGIADEDEKDAKEIVVTGTLIRGIAPTGANAVSVSKEAAEMAGVTDTQQLLGTLPQSSTFLAFPLPGGGNPLGLSRLPINLPNLRNLPGGSLGNPTTLVLMNGHRIVPSGIEQSAVDVGVVPTAIIDRTEIILDGVSSLYGSDAHGGVINFITRKRFDEISIGARYGFADDYWAVGADVTAGTSWGTGGIGITYTYAKNTPLLNGARPDRLTRNFIFDPSIPPNGGNNPNFFNANAPFTATACEDRSRVSTGTGASARFFTGTQAGTAPAVITSGFVNCPANEFSSFVPGQERHGAMAVLSQDFGDSVHFDVSALYAYRQSLVVFGPHTGSATLRGPQPAQAAVGTPGTSTFRPAIAAAPAHPLWQSLAGFGVPDLVTSGGQTIANAQTVAFSYGPLFGTDSSRGTTTNGLWQVTPQLAVDVGTWQVRALASYGESYVETITYAKDAAMESSILAGAVPGVLINPFNITQSTGINTISGMFWQSPRRGEHKYTQLRLTADGPLFTLPGGEVRAAIGAEYQKTTFTVFNTDSATRLARAPASATTQPKSVFGEINVPIFGRENETTLFKSLVLSASGRYDDYEQYGTTFNPKIGLTWQPADFLTLRGNWGTSFRAPTAVEKLGGVSNSLTCFSPSSSEPGCLQPLGGGAINFFVPLPPTGSPDARALPPAGAGVVGLALSGVNDDLVPETSKNWSIGIDLRPIDGLTISSTYYHIDFKNQINIPSTGQNGGADNIYRNAPHLITICNYASAPNTVPSGVSESACNALLLDLVANTTNGPTVLGNIRNGYGVGNPNNPGFAGNPGYAIAYISDSRTTNLGSASVSGVDLSVRYVRPFDWGSLDLTYNANWQLENKTRFLTNSPLADNLETGTAVFQSTMTVGATYGGLRGQVTWQHQSGYDLAASTLRWVGQTRIGAMDIFNASLRYEVPSESPLLNDLELTLTVNNIFDRGSNWSYTSTGGAVANGQTLGRFVQFGLRKKFGLGRDEVAGPPPMVPVAPPPPEPAYTPPPAPEPTVAPPAPPPPLPGERG